MYQVHKIRLLVLIYIYIYISLPIKIKQHVIIDWWIVLHCNICEQRSPCKFLYKKQLVTNLTIFTSYWVLSNDSFTLLNILDGWSQFPKDFVIHDRVLRVITTVCLVMDQRSQLFLLLVFIIFSAIAAEKENQDCKFSSFLSSC